MATNNILNVSLKGSTGSGTFVGANSPTLVTPILGAASATSLAFSSTGEVIGTVTNNSAATGSVGEFVSSTVLAAGAISTTNGAFKDITSISLTAGDWDVWGSICTLPDVTTTTTRVSGIVNDVSATLPTAPAGGTFVYMFIGVTAPGALTFFPVGRRRFSLASTTNIYLIGGINFAVSTMSMYGFIAARRVR